MALKTMRAIAKLRPGPGLDLIEVPVPQPGINDVLIKIKKTSICGTDVCDETRPGTPEGMIDELEGEHQLLQAIDPTVRAVQALVIAPTRELVLQTAESIKDVSRQTGINIEPIYGGMPINQQINNIRRGAQIVIGTPGRLNDHLRRKTLSLNSLKILVLDEADIMLDMGFKEEVDEILTHAPADRRIWLFSATVKDGIEQIKKNPLCLLSWAL